MKKQSTGTDEKQSDPTEDGDSQKLNDNKIREKVTVENSSSRKKYSRLIKGFIILLILLPTVAIITVYQRYQQENEDFYKNDYAELKEKIENISKSQKNLEQNIQPFKTLHQRMSNLENSFSSVQGISADFQNTWILAEAEYYMQTANVQLQLNNNPKLALTALRLADKKISAVDNPELLYVREKLNEEMSELENLQISDIEKNTLKINDLIDIAESLAIKKNSFSGNIIKETQTNKITSFSLALESIKNSIGNLISISRNDELSNNIHLKTSKEYLYTNLILHLQAAKISMLNGKHILFQESMNNSSEWIKKYFDIENLLVANTLTKIQEIQQNTFLTPPDITESLRLLQGYKKNTNLKSSESKEIAQ